jgi:hypothetical protein
VVARYVFCSVSKKFHNNIRLLYKTIDIGYLPIVLYRCDEQGSSVSTVSGYGLEDRAIKVRSPAGEKGFFLLSVSRPALRPTQPPVQWVQGGPFLALKRGRGVWLTINPHLVPRSRMSRSYTSSAPPSAFVACGCTDLAFLYKCKTWSLVVRKNTD